MYEYYSSIMLESYFLKTGINWVLYMWAYVIKSLHKILAYPTLDEFLKLLDLFRISNQKDKY